MDGAVGGDHLPDDGQHRPGRPGGGAARLGRANRNTPDGVHFETVTLVTHGGRPLASRGCRDEGAEAAALRALLEDVDLRACVLTLDALHAARDLIPETLAPFPNARQAFRGVRERTDVKTGGTSTETAYGIASVPAGRAGPERLQAWNRGHW